MRVGAAPQFGDMVDGLAERVGLAEVVEGQAEEVPEVEPERGPVLLYEAEELPDSPRLPASCFAAKAWKNWLTISVVSR